MSEAQERRLISDGQEGESSAITSGAVHAEVNPQEPVKPPTDHWHALAFPSLTDVDVADFEEALFHFALRKVEQAAGDLEAVWARVSLYWRERMPPEAFRVIEDAYEGRVASPSGRVDTGPIMFGTRNTWSKV